jgi:hypothetical protein
VVRVAGATQAIWMPIDGLAFIFLLVAGFAALLDVDLRLSAPRELLITAVLLMLAFVVGAAALLRVSAIDLPAMRVAAAAPAYFGALAIALLPGVRALRAEGGGDPFRIDLGCGRKDRHEQGREGERYELHGSCLHPLVPSMIWAAPAAFPLRISFISAMVSCSSATFRFNASKRLARAGALAGSRRTAARLSAIA